MKKIFFRCLIKLGSKTALQVYYWPYIQNNSKKKHRFKLKEEIFWIDVCRCNPNAVIPEVSVSELSETAVDWVLDADIEIGIKKAVVDFVDKWITLDGKEFSDSEYFLLKHDLFALLQKCTEAFNDSQKSSTIPNIAVQYNTYSSAMACTYRMFADSEIFKFIKEGVIK